MSDGTYMLPETSMSEPPRKKQKVESEPQIQPQIEIAAHVQKAIAGEGIDSTDDVLPDVLCCICLHPAFGGVMTHCQHVFHWSCLFRHLEGSQYKTCALCKEPVDLTGEQSFKPLCRVVCNFMGKYNVQCPQGESFDYYGYYYSRSYYCSYVYSFCCSHDSDHDYK